MTLEELMLLADAYADAASWDFWEVQEGNKQTRADAKADVIKARAALVEALSLTSQFGGL